jgi:pyruvate formate lyase activating enzyme
MKIGGTVEISTKDIPGKVCMVIFTIGCNFHCEFCHNKHLLLQDAGKNIDDEKLINLIKNNSLVNSLSITGGEPSLQPEIINLIEKVAKMNKYISIDTNGTNPEFIKRILPFIDRVALDLKAPLNQKKYERISNSFVNLKSIINTFEILKNNKSIDFEIRTTYVKGLLDQKDIHDIIKFLENRNFRGTYVIQQYQYSEGVGEEFKDKFKEMTHSDIYQVIEPYAEKSLPFEIYVRDDIVGYMSLEKIVELANEEL